MENPGAAAGLVGKINFSTDLRSRQVPEAGRERERKSEVCSVDEWGRGGPGETEKETLNSPHTNNNTHPFN